jgi:phage replication O-like protein O
MPHLSDTEFRVLCVIVRQTLGWKQDAKWLSHSLLKRSTGRESAAISRAVDRLVKRGLIIVRDQDLRRVHKATERRRSRSRLVYSLNHLFLQSAKYRSRVGFEDRLWGSSKSENNKTKREEKKEHGGKHD